MSAQDSPANSSDLPGWWATHSADSSEATPCRFEFAAWCQSPPSICRFASVTSPLASSGTHSAGWPQADSAQKQTRRKQEQVVRSFRVPARKRRQQAADSRKAQSVWQGSCLFSYRLRIPIFTAFATADELRSLICTSDTVSSASFD